MSEIKFKSLEDLYKRIYPALKSKKRELNKKGYNYIHEIDIWNYLKTNKWRRSQDLDLGCMVNDIFNIQDREIDNYVKEEFKNYRREINQEEV